MRKILTNVPLFILLLTVFCSVQLRAQSKNGAVCGDAAQAECTRDDEIFKPSALVFTAQDYAAGTKSDYFYAVLLTTVNGYQPDGGCREISEAQRLAAQELFPNNKAFTYNYYCQNPDLGERFIGYLPAGQTEVDDTLHLLALYGGATQAEAAQILTAAKKKYPKARIVKMRAVVIEQQDY